MRSGTQLKEKCMYESYEWPGAYTLKEDVKIFKKWVQELFVGVLNEIKTKIQ